MNWKIEGLNVALSGALVESAEQKIRGPLSKFGGRVGGAELRLEDRQPGVAPSACSARAVVRLSGARTVALKQEGYDFYSVVDRLARRLRETVAQELRRRDAGRARRHRKARLRAREW